MEKFDKFFELSADLMCVISVDGYFRRLNPAWERSLGYSIAELLARPFVEFIHPDDIGPTLTVVQRHAEGSCVPGFINRYRSKDGSYRALEWSPAPPLNDGLLYLIARDVTERQRAQAILEESESRFKLVADHAPVLIWMSGLNKMCDYFNQGWLEFTGKTMAQETGHGWTEGVHPDDLERCVRVYSVAFDARTKFSMEYRLKRHDGSYRWILDNGVPRFGEGGVFLGYIGSCIDITAQKEQAEHLTSLQEGLAHATRVSLMGQVSAVMAHELNQPLAAILNNAATVRLMLDGPSPDMKKVRQIIDDIIRDDGRASDVISRMRNFFKRGTLDFVPLDVIAEIKDVLQIILPSLERRGVMFQMDVRTEAAFVRGDLLHLQQIFVNLVMNAVDAMATAKLKRLTVTVMRQGDDIVVSVRDTGIGIHGASFEEIFQPFTTTKKDGLGLGLFICRMIMQSHGGRIWGENNAEGGATFFGSLPALKEGFV